PFQVGPHSLKRTQRISETAWRMLRASRQCSFQSSKTCAVWTRLAVLEIDERWTRNTGTPGQLHLSQTRLGSRNTTIMRCQNMANHIHALKLPHIFLFVKYYTFGRIFAARGPQL